jgi:hypothetical protein
LVTYSTGKLINCGIRDYKIGSPKRGDDDRHMADFRPRQHHHLLFGAKGLQQQECTEKEGDDGGPDHRECTNHYDERDR